MIEQEQWALPIPSLAQVAATLTPHVRLYRWRAPVYQTALLRSLGELWDTTHKTVWTLGEATVSWRMR